MSSSMVYFCDGSDCYNSSLNDDAIFHTVSSDAITAIPNYYFKEGVNESDCHLCEHCYNAIIDEDIPLEINEKNIIVLKS